MLLPNGVAQKLEKVEGESGQVGGGRGRISRVGFVAAEPPPRYEEIYSLRYQKAAKIMQGSIGK